MAGEAPDLKAMAEALRKAGFSVSHNLNCLEDSPDGCTTPGEEPDHYHWHEFMDRSSQLFETFNRSIGDHHVLCGDSKARSLATDISRSLWELYQYAGNHCHQLQLERELDGRGDASDRDRG